MADARVTPASVAHFFRRFEVVALQEGFDLLEGMIDDHVFVRWNDGDSVERAAARAAFERMGREFKEPPRR
jgi:hypothetical protein